MAELPQNWQKEYLTNICNVYQPKTISTKELLVDGTYPVYGANGQIGYYHKYNHELPEVLITCRGATCGSINKSVPKSWINGNAMVASPISAVILDKNYLFYYLKSTSFDDYISGKAPNIKVVMLQDFSDALGDIIENYNKEKEVTVQ